MDQARICPSCKKPIASDVPMGLCPECLIQAGFPTGVETEAGTARPNWTPPTSEELAGLFPQLEILELIGKGGMGAVYKARQKRLNRFVALKILPPGIGNDAAFAERFTREAQALAQLNHPGIVTLYEFGETSGQYYFLMEFVDGVNLRQLLATSRVSPREALAIVPQICDALQYAHDQGIVHRDIKPENILLDRRGRVKVADFGLAKLVGAGNEPAADNAFAAGSPTLTDAGKVMGTPNYMSPEQLRSPNEVDHRADIYALGVVFYQMLTGELPGKQLMPPSSKVHIDVRLDEVVLRALEKKPELRYQQASALKTQIETISSSPAAAGPDTRAKASRNWWTGSPFGSSQVREIAAHLTEAEKKELYRLSGLFAVWNAATCFIPLFFIMLAPKPTGWFLGAGALLVGLFFYPTWYRMQSKFLCSTEWARRQGYTIHNLRKYSFSAGNIWKAVLIFAALMLAAYAFQRSIFHYVETDTSVQSDHIGSTYFPLGDEIQVNSVERSAKGIVVKGHYRLVSADEASLALNFTSTNRTITLGEPNQSVRISKGQGDFELSRTNPVPGFPHVSMYNTRSAFAGVYFGTQEEAYETKGRYGNYPTETPLASAETWSPAVPPKEMQDWQKILEEAKDLMNRSQYEESLKREIWFHNHVAESGDSYLKIVRIGSALTDWVELGRRYPKAREALMEIRDGEAYALLSGKGYSEMFVDLQAINRELQFDDSTYAVFKQIREKDPALAKQCHIWVQGLLVAKGDYQWLYEQIGDAQARFDSIKQSLQMNRDNQKRTAEMRQKMTQQMAETSQRHGMTNAPRFVAPDNSAMQKKAFEDQFVGQTRQLIEILVGAGHKADAEKIRDEAVAVLEDGRLKSAVSDAESNVAKHHTISSSTPSDGAARTLTEQPPVVVETFPACGASNVAPGEVEVRVRFSKRMADHSWSWTAAWPDSTPIMLGEPRYESQGRICIVKVRLEPGRTYAWQLNGDELKSFIDRSGHPAVPYLFSFQTR